MVTRCSIRESISSIPRTVIASGGWNEKLAESSETVRIYPERETTTGAFLTTGGHFIKNERIPAAQCAGTLSLHNLYLLACPIAIQWKYCLYPAPSTQKSLRVPYCLAWFGWSWLRIYLLPLPKTFALCRVLSCVSLSTLPGWCIVSICLSIINMPKKIPELWKHSQFHINDNLYRSLCFLGAFVAAVFVIYECLTIQMFQVIGILIYLCISCIYPALRAKYSNVEIHVSYEET